jgi:hypothetical protein
MDHISKIYIKIEQLLDELIAVAEDIGQSSQHDISIEYLEKMQQKQESIIEELDLVSKELNSTSSLSAEGDEYKQKVKKKLQYFQSLNEKYLKNIEGIRKVIDFHFRQKES